MRIVIDMQGAQTESRFRGIGRYSLSLAQAVVRNRGEHEIILALNGLFPDTIEPIRAAFNGLLPQENIRVWHAPGPVKECEPGNEWRHKVAERIRAAFLADLRPDVVHVSSLFEGYVDDAVTSICIFASQIPTAVTLYDLIPLLNPEQYLHPDPRYARYYQRKIEHLKRANQCLAISESAAGEGLNELALPANAVVNISAACDAIFHRLEMQETDKQDYLRQFNIARPFILYSGSSDAHKNLHRLIRAYARLSKTLRDTYQLVLVGRMTESDVSGLWQIAKSAGISQDQLLFTGYITDEELTRLYNLCAVFVLPSLHEGFGLPALEAMSCGAAVIGSNTTSVPEVIGRPDALFDPCDEGAISRKLSQVLDDKDFRNELIAHGLKQAKKFSWDESARRALSVFEKLHANSSEKKSFSYAAAQRPKLAFVSPLPPEQTGIADYSAELLPELAKHYDIEVVVAQEQVSDAWVQSNCRVRDPQWLRANSHLMDRVIYQMGNSPFHQHMLTLMEEIPGTVVLHDFFLSGLISYLEQHNIAENVWAQALHHSHGYAAVRERYHRGNTTDVRMKYPVNLQVLQHAQGVIVHSEYSRKLAADWFGNDFTADWMIIPHLRIPNTGLDHIQSRAVVGLKENDFVVCSFGSLNPTKLNHRLLDAWLSSRLAEDNNCMLVFVGENHGGEYGNQLLETIRASGLQKRILITGWVDMHTFQSYLAATNIAVQLRTRSRGETSGAVLHCMNYGLPTIVNANGSMAELASDAVWKLTDEFEDKQLIQALETLGQDKEKRDTMGMRAQEAIRTHHAPRVCAEKYTEAIERFYARSRTSGHALTMAIAAIDGYQPTDAEYLTLAKNIALSLPLRRPAWQLLLDVSATSRNDLKTGIERVARALAVALLDAPPEGYRVEPVYLTNKGGSWHYRYASRYTLGLLGCPPDVLVDEVVEPHNGDVLLGLDLSGQMLVEAEAAGLFKSYRNAGVAVFFMVHDLLSVQMPQYFPPGAEADHAKRLKSIAKLDGVVCISHTVANELSAWLKTNSQYGERTFNIDWFNLGADVDKSVPTCGLPDDAEQVLTKLSACPSFLMVGTIEPRKGYLQTLEAFTKLWREDLAINLVVVGHEGWKNLPYEKRRTIPEIVSRMRNHDELNKRLFWLEGISDEYLEKIYAASTCLIAASEGEGFGLPLIEAARHKLPIIARDIPVFREVAGEHAYYFKNSNDPQILADAIIEWTRLFEKGEHPKSDAMPWLTWKQSAEKLLAEILPKRPAS